MEVQVHTRLKALILALAALLALLPVSARPREEKADSLVRLMKAESIEQLQINGQQYRKALFSTFLHNGTYLISDTALWNVDSKVIKANGHVKVIQDETILTSDKLDYIIDDNLAQFRGTLVQLQNKKQNQLRTRNLDYNTKDSVAVFRGGASMRDEQGQVIESLSGTYYSGSGMFIFDDRVNMFSDSMFVKTNRLFYYSNAERAEFPVPIDFWKDGNMLSAQEGWYDRGAGTVFFTKSVHGMSEDQEAWTDSLYYYRGTGNILMMGNAQVQDPSRKVTAVADRIHYEDSLKQVMLRRNAAAILETEENSKRDTIYMGADTLIYRSVRRCDIPDGTVKACETRLSDIMTDPVTEFRRKAAEAAAAAAEEARQQRGGGPRSMQGGAKKDAQEPEPPAPEASEPEPQEPEPPAPEPTEPKSPEPEAPQQPDSAAAAQHEKDSLMAPLTNALAMIDSLAGTAPPADSLSAPGAPAPTGEADAGEADAEEVDTEEEPRDTTATEDTLAVPEPPKDTTKVGFVYGIRKVRVFRKDIQMRCDSMAYCDLDSIARFYMDPVVWNDGNRQYTSDSLFILVGGGGIRKASLQSNALVIIEEDPNSYDQIKGTEIIAYFDSLDSSLKRFDALGGSTGIFYLKENGAFATVNKVESKMLSGILKDGDIEQVYYFEQPKNNAFPVVQLPDAEKKLKGFNWRPDERPASPEDITRIKPRSSQRSFYASKPQAEFVQTEKYFPGYIPRIRREIAIRDSLAKLPKPQLDTTVVLDSAQIAGRTADSLAARPDSLPAAADSLLAAADSLAAATPDSLSASVPAAAVAAATVTAEESDPLAVPTIDPKQKRKEEQELRRKMRIAARDARIAAREARWAELDRQDSLKLAAKKQKELEKKRAKTLRLLKAEQKQKAKDEAKLQKYIEKYRKQYEREQKRKVPAPAESGEQAPRGDAVLGDDGTVDDSAVLGSGGVPGP